MQLTEVVDKVAIFITPMIDALQQGKEWEAEWCAGGPWLTEAVVGKHEAELLENTQVKKALSEGIAQAKAGKTHRNAIDLDKYDLTGQSG